MQTNKPAFYKVGNYIINRYEVRQVRLIEPNPYPAAIVTYKDGSRIKVTGTRVPMFVNWVLEKPVTEPTCLYNF